MRIALLLCAWSVSALAQVTVTTSTIHLSGTDCPNDNAYDVTVYRPEGAPPFPIVGIAHGYQLAPASYDVLARAMAADGVMVVVPKFPTVIRCQPSNHARNGRILMAAIDAQIATSTADSTKIGLIGHSAGGLSVYLSAATRSVKAVVLLDPVDSNDTGLAVSAAVMAPTLFLFAEPALCNSMGNGAGWFAGKSTPKARLKVVNALHCDPQNPIGTLCAAGCPGAPDPQRTEIFTNDAQAFIRRYVLGNAQPCLEDAIQRTLTDGKVSDVDVQLGGCVTVIDAGVDAGGAAGTDGGSALDGGAGASDPARGCGCDAGSTMAAGLAVVVAMALRRRASRRS